MKITTRQMLQIAVFTAVTAVMSQISVNIPPVPFTMSVFAVFLSGALLGSRNGFLSQLVYVLLGAAGVPVFQGLQGGLGIIAGARGGYILSYPLMALVIGLLVERKKQPSRMEFAGSMLIGMVVCYTFGASWLAAVAGFDFAKALTVGVAPFLAFDIIKVILASLLAYQVRQSLTKAGLLS